MNDKIRKYLILGIIGGVLTMIGDCMLCGVDSYGATGGLDQYAVMAVKISYTRIGLAGFFGFVGIPLTVFGFYVLYMTLEDKGSKAAQLYRASLYGYLALGGAVHVICCYLMTGLKKALETGADNLLMTILREQGGYVIPSMAVFLVFYLMSVVTMIILITKKKTFLPPWTWILNPLTFKLVFNVLGRLGNSAVLNGILCSNMSLGAIIIFAAWWIALNKRVDVSKSVL